MTQIAPSLSDLARKAAAASRKVGRAPTAIRDTAIHAIADALVEKSSVILAANQSDVTRVRGEGLSPSLLDRLTLTEDRLKAIADDVH